MSTFQCEDSGLARAASNTVWVEEKAKQSSKVNAMWKQQPGLSTKNPSAQYYQVKLQSGDDGVWFGLTPQDKFGTGWSCKGFFYGGNTSDGGALMRQSFGPRPKCGDIIGMRAELISQGKDKDFTLQIYFALNDKPLGLAFEIAGITQDNLQPLYPCVSFNSGPSKAEIIRSSVPPVSSFEKQLGQTRTKLDGSWKASASDLLPGSDLNLPDVSFVLDEEKWGFTAKVCNSLMVKLSPTSPHKSNGPAMSTRALPLPHLQPLEQQVSKIMSSVEDVNLENGNLILKAAGDVFTLFPNEGIIEPVSRQEINWLK